MKLLTLVVHTDVQQDLVALLRNMDQVSGFTIIHAEGHGEEEESDKFLSARDKVVGFAPRIRTELLLETNASPDVVACVPITTHAMPLIMIIRPIPNKTDFMASFLVRVCQRIMDLVQLRFSNIV